MSISRVYPATWGVGDKLTSSQMNQVDANVTNALDKRSGQTDTLQSVVTESGAGRLLPSVVTGADADTTYHVGDGCRVIRLTSAITAPRAYTLSATGAQNGDRIKIIADATLTQVVTIKDQGGTSIFVVSNDGTTGDGTWVGCEYLGGWLVVEQSQGTRNRSQLFTASGTFVVPTGVTKLTLHGIGGGGGGGGAGGELSVGTTAGGGGGGGGGARLGVAEVTVTPGTSIAVTIPAAAAGGSGGSPNNAGANGADGGDVTFGALATFYGAGGGLGGEVGSVSAASYVAGGSSHRLLDRGTVSLIDRVQPCRGGAGFRYPHGTFSSPASRDVDGAASVVVIGASAGATGTDGSQGGGGGGGGGGASEWVGCAPGAGGNGKNDGVSGAGNAGTAGTLGAGGGGGGAAARSAGLVSGGAGAAGGTGAVRVMWSK
jgi:hypothetical protein